jgi:hypothetical protein
MSVPFPRNVAVPFTIEELVRGDLEFLVGATDEDSIKAIIHEWEYGAAFTPEEVKSWVEVGVFDAATAHRLATTTDLTPDDIKDLTFKGDVLGYALANGDVTVGHAKHILRMSRDHAEHIRVHIEIDNVIAPRDEPVQWSVWVTEGFHTVDAKRIIGGKTTVKKGLDVLIPARDEDLTLVLLLDSLNEHALLTFGGNKDFSHRWSQPERSYIP